MSIKSMTGYGNAEVSRGGIKWDLQISSVNRKQFDLRLAIPRELAILEARITELVHSSVSRGSVLVSIKTAGTTTSGSKVFTDHSLAQSYIQEAKRMANKLAIKNDLGVRAVLSMPGVTRLSTPGDDPESVWRIIKPGLVKALAMHNKSRLAEGARLEKYVRRRLALLENIAKEIAKLAPKVLLRYRENLKQRVEQAGIDTSAFHDALAREMVLFADKSDISEEMARLHSHFRQADEIMKGSRLSGRPLDFLCQEFLREINTIGSKANDASITSCVVKFKSELEAVREQVQNVE